MYCTGSPKVMSVLSVYTGCVKHVHDQVFTEPKKPYSTMIVAFYKLIYLWGKGMKICLGIGEVHINQKTKSLPFWLTTMGHYFRKKYVYKSMARDKEERK